MTRNELNNLISKLNKDKPIAFYNFDNQIIFLTSKMNFNNNENLHSLLNETNHIDNIEEDLLTSFIQNKPKYNSYYLEKERFQYLKILNSDALEIKIQKNYRNLYSKYYFGAFSKNVYKRNKHYTNDLMKKYMNDKSKISEEILIKEKKASAELNFEESNNYFKLLNVLEENINQSESFLEYEYIEEFHILLINIFIYVDNKKISIYNYIQNVISNIEDELFFIKEIFLINNSHIKTIKEVKTTNEDINSFWTQLYYKAQKEFNKTIKANRELEQLLNIKNINLINVFDISNMNLENPVAGMVVYKDSLKCKSLYRKYHLTPTYQDSDYHFMKEVIYRRYSHEENRNIDLIIVDGGKLQILAAKESLEQLGIWETMNIIGLKKDDNHKTDCIVTKNFEEIKLPKDSELFYFLENMQDEVHRFAINFFAKTNLKTKFISRFEEIKHLSKKQKEKLIEEYVSFENLLNANEEELKEILTDKQLEQIRVMKSK